MSGYSLFDLAEALASLIVLIAMASISICALELVVKGDTTGACTLLFYRETRGGGVRPLK